jgi:hypothetical protein
MIYWKGSFKASIIKINHINSNIITAKAAIGAIGAIVTIGAIVANCR